MHNYLRAIGFSNIVNRIDFDDLLNQILEESKENSCIDIDEEIKFIEL